MQHVSKVLVLQPGYERMKTFTIFTTAPLYSNQCSRYVLILKLLYVTLDHKTSLNSLGYICSNSQKYIEWVKIIDFSFMPKSLGH